MATFHLHGQIITRSDGRSAVGAAAYRSGQALHDDRLGKVFDYTRKSKVEESIILGPERMPEWLRDRELLWNTVELAESRSNSQLAREFDIALPIELVRLDPKAAKQTLVDWAEAMFVEHGLIVDINFHDFATHNPHGHLMTTTRVLHPAAGEFEEGSRYVFGEKARHLNDRGYMDFWRETWADYANAALAARGINARIDHRSLADQGITDREPQIHVGPNANAMWDRRIETGRWEANAAIASSNHQRVRERCEAIAEAQAAAERSAREAEIVEASRQRMARDLTQILEQRPQLERLSERLSIAMQSTIANKTGEVGRVGMNLADAVQGAVRAKRLEARSVLGAFSQVVAVHQAGVAASAAGVHDLTIRMKKAIMRTVGGLVIEVEELDPDQEPSVVKWWRPGDDEPESPLSPSMAAWLASVSDRLKASAPTIDEPRRKLEELSARFGSAASGLIERPRSLLASLSIRLEALRPAERSAPATTDLERGEAGASAPVYFVPEACSGEEDWFRSTQPMEAPTVPAVEEPAEEVQPVLVDLDQLAERLVMDMIFKRCPVAIRRSNGRYVTDRAHLPEEYRNLPDAFDDEWRLRRFVDDIERNRVRILEKLIRGDERVVRDDGDRLIFIPGESRGALAELANELLAGDECFRIIAKEALARWDALERDKPLHSSPAAAQPQVQRAPAPQPVRTPPDGELTPYERAVLATWAKQGMERD